MVSFANDGRAQTMPSGCITMQKAEGVSHNPEALKGVQTGSFGVGDIRMECSSGIFTINGNSNRRFGINDPGVI